MWYVGGACSNTPPDIIVKNCWFNQQGNLLKQVFWHWMSHLSESMAMTPWSAMSFTILSVFEPVNQVDRGLKWLTIQEDIQSYKSFQPCHSLVCEIHKAHPSQFLPAGYAKGHGQLILRSAWYHTCMSCMKTQGAVAKHWLSYLVPTGMSLMSSLSLAGHLQ